MQKKRQKLGLRDANVYIVSSGGFKGGAALGTTTHLPIGQDFFP